jgi:hypothetical protein
LAAEVAALARHGRYGLRPYALSAIHKAKFSVSRVVIRSKSRAALAGKKAMMTFFLCRTASI